MSDDYDKIDRLVEVREASVNRIARWESDASARQDADIELSEDDIFLGKLENGLATLQLADFVLAMACVEDDGVCLSLAAFQIENTNHAIGPRTRKDAVQQE